MKKEGRRREQRPGRGAVLRRKLRREQGREAEQRRRQLEGEMEKELRASGTALSLEIRELERRLASSGLELLRLGSRLAEERLRRVLDETAGWQMDRDVDSGSEAGGMEEGGLGEDQTAGSSKDGGGGGE